MTREEIFAIWAPSDGVWSPWVKPVLFAHMNSGIEPPEPGPSPIPDLSWCAPADGRTVCLLDIRAGVGVQLGLALAERGYRPVPLYNAAPGPMPLLDVQPIIREIVRSTPRLAELRLPALSPPAFLLDSRRRFGDAPPAPGRFDNRSISLPTDFPSANLLLSRGVRMCLLITDSPPYPQADLAHTLRRWEDAEIEIVSRPLTQNGPPVRIKLPRPGWFRALGQRMLAVMGLRRNPLGGFGGVVPVPSSG